MELAIHTSVCSRSLSTTTGRHFISRRQAALRVSAIMSSSVGASPYDETMSAVLCDRLDYELDDGLTDTRSYPEKNTDTVTDI